MNTYKVTYWAYGLHYSSSVEAASWEVAMKIFKSIPGFQKFDD